MTQAVTSTDSSAGGDDGGVAQLSILGLDPRLAAPGPETLEAPVISVPQQYPIPPG